MFEQTMDATLIPQVLWASLFEGGVFLGGKLAPWIFHPDLLQWGAKHTSGY